MTQVRAVLAGTGIAVPPLEIDNDRLSMIIETSDEWIRERSGVRTRYYVEPGVGSSDLGTQAARAALDDAGMDPGEIDYLVCDDEPSLLYVINLGSILSVIGIAVADDAPLPVMKTKEDFVAFMKATPSIAYTVRGVSGVHMAQLIEQLGLVCVERERDALGVVSSPA